MKTLYSFTITLLVSIYTLLYTTSCNHSDLTQYVNPLVGTDAHGHTYPGATVPFGMMQLSPDTRLDGWDGCSGYHYSDTVIYGFSHTHLSGTGVADYCDILFMPVGKQMLFDASTPDNQAGGYASVFSHKNETAKPGFYSVFLEDDKIQADFTVTPRTGIHKYTFTQNEKQFVMLDLKHRDEVLESYIHIISDTEIAGYRRSKAWANDQRVYFYASFSRPFIAHKVREGKSFLNTDTLYKGDSLVAGFEFDTNEGNELLMKIAISGVDENGARNNLFTEQPGWNFDSVYQAVKKDWNTELSKIEINGGPNSRKRTFYTALYHSFLAPNLYTDADERFRGADKEIHTAEGFTNYTVFSLWDTYRAAHPLYTFTQPQRTNDFINTFLHQYKHSGLLPVWELSANETFCMIGYHSVSVIADAYMKNYRNFDVNLALEAMQNSANKDHFGLKYYKELGFIPIELEHESVSKTLEYTYNDWCIAIMANEAGNMQVYNEYILRAQYYKNIFDSGMKFFRPRQNGSWLTPFDPKEVTFHYTEANGWQYNFAAQQDVAGMIQLNGGEEKFCTTLDSMFFGESKLTGRQQVDITGLIGQYAHGNEPSHHIPYLYALAGNPQRTQDLVTRIMDEFYTDEPDGLCGNEDCGQMSAWYVLSAMGFYQVTPGDPRYTIGMPQFKTISINAGVKPFVIKAHRLTSAKQYIKSMKWNGETYTKGYITHNQIMEGGILEMEMTEEFSEAFVPTPENRAISSIQENNFIPSPVLMQPNYSFADSMQISFVSPAPNTQIYYTTDGSIPNSNSTQYKTPFTIYAFTRLKAISIASDGKSSKVITAEYAKYDKSRKVNILSKYNRQYSAGGDFGLIDGLRGADNFRNGKWQGYQSQDFEAIVDLGKEQLISKVGAGFLQEIRSWIWMPVYLEVEVSKDGNTFTKLATIQNTISHTSYDVVNKDFIAEVKAKARFVKFKAKNFGKIPDWHLGKGGDAFIFIDELIIE